MMEEAQTSSIRLTRRDCSRGTKKLFVVFVSEILPTPPNLEINSPESLPSLSISFSRLLSFLSTTGESATTTERRGGEGECEPQQSLHTKKSKVTQTERERKCKRRRRRESAQFPRLDADGRRRTRKKRRERKQAN